MAFETIVKLLYERIGLNPSSIGESSIQRAIDHRMASRGCKNIQEYFQLLEQEIDEVHELIEEIVVPETWFFRNKMPFEAFKKTVVEDLLPKTYKKKPIRILSIPCATGEEPYSLAITLVEQKINPQYFHIDAVDVSTKAIELAKYAHYGKNSFRDVDPEIQAKYFTKTEKGWLINDPIRNLVKFKHGNILVGALSPHPGYYDVVFCRNLLIYFDRQTQQTTLEKLYRALKKGGVLFIGHAEASQVSDEYFERSKYPKSFAFIKRSKPIKKTPSQTQQKTIVSQLQKAAHKLAAKPSALTPNRRPKTKETVKSQTRKSTKQPVVESLRPAEKLVNEGRYEEAQQFCCEYLKHHPDSAQGHYLLGLIKNTTGEQKTAESFLKKAIYLDPNHELALVLSCSIAEQKGDEEAVHSFKKRLARVRRRITGSDG